MVTGTDMEDDLLAGAGEEAGGGPAGDETDGGVDEFDLAEIRREFAGEGDAGTEEHESDSADDAGRSERSEEGKQGDSGSEGGAFGSDRERYQAVIRAAREHGLGIDDLEALERSESLEEVERRARSTAERRTLRRRVEALERQLAPVQQFDSNRPGAAASVSEEAWIDRYMAGDRSARAVAAARRAFE